MKTLTITKTQLIKYIDTVRKSNVKAYRIPFDVIRKNKNIIREHNIKYLDYLVWIYITAPEPESNEEKECLNSIFNVLISTILIENNELDTAEYFSRLRA